MPEVVQQVNEMIPTTPDAWIGVGFLVLAVVFFGVGLVVRARERKRNAARIEELERRIAEWNV